jgi:hypothetical protein
MKSKKKVKKMSKSTKGTVPRRCGCEKKAAREILKRNMSKEPTFQKESYLFAERFLVSLLKEQSEEATDMDISTEMDSQITAPEDFTPEKNQEDFENSLEPETNSGEFDVDGISADVTVDTIKRVKDWALKLNEFEKFLNNPSESSLHRILADNDRAGSLLRGITRKASDSITRIAGEIAKLKEVLNTFVNTAPKKMRDTEQLKMGS